MPPKCSRACSVLRVVADNDPQLTVVAVGTPARGWCREPAKELPLTADISVAPEIAILAEASLLIPAQPARAAVPAARPTLGTLARHLRLLAAAPERWWGL